MRRLSNEWRLLNELVSLNPWLLASTEWITQHPLDSFRLRLCGLPAMVEREGLLQSISEHSVEFRFPRFYPAVPMELYLHTPAFHPNIDPLNGFICLWDRHAPQYTVIEAMLRLRGILTYRLVNYEARHSMQPAAVAHCRSRSSPLECREIALNPDWRLRQESARSVSGRRRLSS